MQMDRYVEKKGAQTYIWFIPENLYKGTLKGAFEGLCVLKECEDYLQFRYGEWRTPVSDWDTSR